MRDLAQAPIITDWMQAWGTLAGSLFSAFAFAATVGLLWHEIRIRRTEEVDRLAAQARMVLISVLDARGDVSDGTARMLIVNVRNHSRAPIIDVAAYASRRGDTDGGRDSFEFHVEVIEANQSDSDLWLLTSPVRTSRQTPIADQIESGVSFTDAQGLRWVRNGRDQPERQF